MKKQPIELIPGLRIGVGVGRLILSHKTVDEDGLERWAVNYHLTVGGPIRESVFMSANVIQYLAKVEPLERENKTRYEYGRRYFNRCTELQEQLTRSENLREVANKVNQERIDELERVNVELIGNLEENRLYHLEKYDKFRIESNQLNSIIQSEQSQNKIAFRIIDKLKFWNMVFSIISLMFFALWISAMYF
jgi:hypothetical protein